MISQYILHALTLVSFHSPLHFLTHASYKLFNFDIQCPHPSLEGRGNVVVIGEVITTSVRAVRGTPQGHMTPTSCNPVEFPHSRHNLDNQPRPAMQTLSIHPHSKLATSQLTHTTNPLLTHTSNQLANPLSGQAQSAPMAPAPAPAPVTSIDWYIPPHWWT